MKDNIKCNLIKDLLPLYVENLVSEESKKEIEKHIKECNICLEELENIKKENRLITDEEFCDNKEEEKKCVKKIKRKITVKIIIAIIMSILLTFTWIEIRNTYRIIKDEDGKYILYNLNTGNIQKGKYGINIIAKYTERQMGRDIKHYLIFTFDNNDKCINCRRIISGYREKQMEDHKAASDGGHFEYNTEIKDGKIYFNDNIYIGKSKEKILKILKQFDAEIEEI